MSIWNSLLQGIVQGLTEFLPVSSSGHLSVFQHLTGQSGDMGLMFSVFLHFGTLIAVFIAFYKTIWSMICAFFRMVGKLFTGKFRFKTLDVYERLTVLLLISLLPMLFAFLLRDFYAGFSTDSSILVEGVCFLITAALLFLSTKFAKGTKDGRSMQISDALIVGCTQAIAPMPGISRSGSTIAAGLLCGLDRELAVQFSFIMGIPTVLGANILELGDAIQTEANVEVLPLLIGIVTAAVFGFLAIRLVQWLVKSDHFRIFAVYTLVLGILVIGISIFEAIVGQNISAYFGWIG